MNKSHNPERRLVLSGLAALGLIGLTGYSGGSKAGGMMARGAPGYHPPLPQPGTTGGNSLHLPTTFTGNSLSVVSGSYDLGAGQQNGALLYNGAWPSPLIRIAQGGALDVTLHNQLSESTNVHWHGLVAAPGMDGHPTELVLPGTSKRYAFTVNERPGTYWYHPHPDGATARQAYSGLAGMLIVDDGNDASRGLPTGTRDIPLVLADKRVNNGALTYQLTFMDVMTGWLGNVMTVNGTAEPVKANVEPAVIRLRLLNASNARILNPALSNGQSFWLIGTDGGLLPAPVAVSNLLLAPGERAEVLLDLRGAAGQTVKLVSAAFSLTGSGMMGGGMMAGGMMGTAPSQGAAFDLVTFTASALSATHPGSIPPAFLPIERFDPAQATVHRTFTLTEMSGMTNGLHRINGLVYNSARIDFVALRGDLERWQFINYGMVPHPMHVHGTQFQVLSRDGNAAKRFPTDLGWKDTVLVRSMETVEIALRFASAGNYVLHCHNLEHEDDGMMLNFNVI